MEEYLCSGCTFLDVLWRGWRPFSMHISIRQLIMIAMGILPRSVEYRAQNKHCLDTHNQVLGKWYVSSSEAVSNLSSFCLFERTRLKL